MLAVSHRYLRSEGARIQSQGVHVEFLLDKVVTA